jgi:hypothetical protein
VQPGGSSSNSSSLSRRRSRSRTATVDSVETRGRQATAANLAAIGGAAAPQVPGGSNINFNNSSSRARMRSRTAAVDSPLAGGRQAPAANLPVYGGAAAPGSNSNSSSETEKQQLLVQETELVQLLRWSAADEPSQLQQHLPRVHDAMQQLKQLPAGSLARTQFDNNWAYVQAWRVAEDKQRTLQFVAKLLDDALDSSA